MLVGPPVGGILYSHLGFRAPFIFGEICTVIDLIGRLLIIERKDALRWGHDPSALPVSDTPETPATATGATEIEEKGTETPELKIHLSLIAVIKLLLKSSRALIALAITLTYGYFVLSSTLDGCSLIFCSVIFTNQETVLPLRLQSQFGFDAGKVGIVVLAAVVPNVFCEVFPFLHMYICGSSS